MFKVQHGVPPPVGNVHGLVRLLDEVQIVFGLGDDIGYGLCEIIVDAASELEILP